MKFQWRAFLVLTGTMIGAASAQSNWPRFRGPDGAGISRATTIPAEWTDEDYNWQVDLPGAGHASPVIWGERIYCTCADPKTARRTVLCFRAGDGHLMWRRDFESRAYRQHSSNGFATATPAADDKGVVVTWTTPDETRLISLGPDGQTQWQIELGPFVGPHGSGSSPVIIGDIVVLASMQEDLQLLGRIIGRENPNGPIGKSLLTAVDRATGESRWRLKCGTTLASYSTPLVRLDQRQRQQLICTSTSHGISAIDVATGKVLWESPGLFEDRCVGSPIVAGELVLGSYGHGTRGTLLAAVRGEANESVKVVYEVTKAVPLVPTPIAVNGLVFLWNDAGVVTCLRAKTGRQLWQERVGGSYFGSPVCVDNRLYCIDKRGTVVVIAAADRYELLGRTALGEASYATPAVADDVMYLRSQTKLFSLGG